MPMSMQELVMAVQTLQTQMKEVTERLEALSKKGGKRRRSEPEDD